MDVQQDRASPGISGNDAAMGGQQQALITTKLQPRIFDLSAGYNKLLINSNTSGMVLAQSDTAGVYEISLDGKNTAFLNAIVGFLQNLPVTELGPETFWGVAILAERIGLQWNLRSWLRRFLINSGTVNKHKWYMIVHHQVAEGDLEVKEIVVKKIILEILAFNTPNLVLRDGTLSVSSCLQNTYQATFNDTWKYPVFNPRLEASFNEDFNTIIVYDLPFISDDEFYVHRMCVLFSLIKMLRTCSCVLPAGTAKWYSKGFQSIFSILKRSNPGGSETHFGWDEYLDENCAFMDDFAGYLMNGNNFCKLAGITSLWNIERIMDSVKSLPAGKLRRLSFLDVKILKENSTNEEIDDVVRLIKSSTGVQRMNLNVPSIIPVEKLADLTSIAIWDKIVNIDNLCIKNLGEFLGDEKNAAFFRSLREKENVSRVTVCLPLLLGNEYRDFDASEKREELPLHDDPAGNEKNLQLLTMCRLDLKNKVKTLVVHQLHLTESLIQAVSHLTIDTLIIKYDAFIVPYASKDEGVRAFKMLLGIQSIKYILLSWHYAVDSKESIFLASIINEALNSGGSAGKRVIFAMKSSQAFRGFGINGNPIAKTIFLWRRSVYAGGRFHPIETGL